MTKPSPASLLFERLGGLWVHWAVLPWTVVRKQGAGRAALHTLMSPVHSLHLGSTLAFVMSWRSTRCWREDNPQGGWGCFVPRGCLTLTDDWKHRVVFPGTAWKWSVQGPGALLKTLSVSSSGKEMTLKVSEQKVTVLWQFTWGKWALGHSCIIVDNRGVNTLGRGFVWGHVPVTQSLWDPSPGSGSLLSLLHIFLLHGRI